MRKRWVVRGDTSRQADLYGFFDARTTSLGTLRKFVAALEKWPDSAKVKSDSGLVIRVTTWAPAEPFATEDGADND